MAVILNNMNISPNSIPMYFALSALFLFLAAVIQRLNQFYSLPQHKTFKHVAIDGLRGFLALGVFFHHSLINYNYIATGVWTTPNSRFYTMLGQLSVGLFFAITAFLFWSKVLDSRDGINWKTLYVSRVRRIMPMYLVSVVIVIVFTLVLAYSENVALFSTVESFVGMCQGNHPKK
ncbi:acyltransferase family protein [Hydromonas duriensis]|uniref:Acyltransferase-like protein n=1 Tax=Hydromonas duriensis TaxID=1527608 RepID=A0A4R6Y019_9BURK|nr:acyltransferase family protein [Hydromonas duriensis]TDR27720.1 acyltransferase-like protein [Hydromonas duriensis]